MYAEERHQAIAQLVAHRGRVAVNELATRFDVTTQTLVRPGTSPRLDGSSCYAGCTAARWPRGR